ncbi:hypothetical protein ACQP1O_13500 [Nocardia sp. CA-151230]|uniref:hypothetical protein n=1 Tax=Nocardia sp. CA-151230 TaxID=3239982 RepID=UPI003D908764
MKPLSETLTELAARVKQVEDSSDALRDKNHAALQERHRELGVALERESGELGNIGTEMRASAHRWWVEARDSLHRQIAAMRSDFDSWQAEAKEKNQEKLTHDAQADALTAVALAGYCLDAAEWAVLRAGLLAAKPLKGHSEDQPVEKP